MSDETEYEILPYGRIRVPTGENAWYEMDQEAFYDRKKNPTYKTISVPIRPFRLGRGHYHDLRIQNPYEELCRNCGITPTIYVRDYESSIKLVHAGLNRGVWNLGEDWVIKDQPNDAFIGNDVITQDFIRKNGLKIPVLSEQRILKVGPEDKRCITLMRRAPGMSLAQAWPTLSKEEKEMYAKEVAGYVQEMRKIQSPRMMAANGGLLIDKIAFRRSKYHWGEYPSQWIHMGGTTEEWFKQLKPGLIRTASQKSTDPKWIEYFLKKMRDLVPECEPYVLTHGDLSPSNIIIHEGHVSAIIDWEFSGFYPSWYESYYHIEANHEWVLFLSPLLEQDGAPECKALQLYNFWIQQFPQRGGIYPMKWKEQELSPFCDCKPYLKTLRTEISNNQHKILTSKRGFIFTGEKVDSNFKGEIAIASYWDLIKYEGCYKASFNRWWEEETWLEIDRLGQPQKQDTA